ncbi:MAG: hypothetical protein H0T51_05670 [Pirellulales bacterium]|nr:hypothetical protein [Pirellulales bacterium]
MNAMNRLVHVLQSLGGFATREQLESVRPKLKDVMKVSVELVDAGWAAWDEAPDGSQQLRLTENTLAMMSPNAKKMTHGQLR